ncbi:MarR family protein [Actinopolymorpha cephalotaxi]|uniref:DNA-binding MarR family transcriptional regulator n=1 Tax=Actinopolymorpha cephalotaxi TaxID=504797 RepID=A0A1I2RKQ8_9ACTN|nr:MarR family transcriptional regulator [Actinopolymorpha cephalotaxi]NYH82270.1 DNA-binding MarR family transcriptional regulator [Actinopolymorpha cephalotaxi]SFG38421.1 MarR family protein [Actinopolymorpha cephalotaxi]
MGQPHTGQAGRPDAPGAPDRPDAPGRSGDAEDQSRPDRPRDDLSLALRDVLDLNLLVRGALARRLGMPLTDVEAVEHVIAAQGQTHLRAKETGGAGLGPVELSRRLGITSAAATQTVNRLVADGHVRRTPHPGDRRRQVLSVTESGMRDVMRELLPLLDLVSAVTAERSPEEREIILSYLRDVATAFQAYLHQEGPPAGE